ncbi:hypothetical protein NBH00_06605 [Paraconexibacter antarcticus]|uniref:SdpI family protein n=1 Tax=Paraconexibacter antarcticus TaxID=2949664 RepID=A0ABY5DZ48_9ACTN|nr:hypothetical protein [Paraconexibacter antarcticus]UTI65880.1 hypothetical protein NBH00_06605 [Paraconexibacter antarcticus]
MTAYLIAVLAGIALPVCRITDVRLTAQKINPDCPAMEPGQWLARRYIECLLLGSFCVLGAGVYFFVKPSAAFFMTPIVALPAYVAVKAADTAIMARFQPVRRVR